MKYVFPALALLALSAPLAHAIDFKAMAEKAKALNDARNGNAPAQTAAASGGNLSEGEKKDLINQLTYAWTTDKVKAILAKGIDPNCVDPGTDESVFFGLVKAGKYQGAQALLDAGANPDSKDRDGEVLFNYISSHMPFEQDGINFVANLVEKGATITNPTRSGSSLPVIDIIGDDTIKQPVRLKMLQVFLKHGFDPNKLPANGEITALQSVLRVNDTESANLLLDNKANINLANDKGDTALHYMIGDYKSAMLLLGKNADVKVKNKQGETPVMVAAEAVSRASNQDNAIAVLSEILKKKPDLKTKDANGVSPLLHCKFNKACEKVMKKAGAKA